MSITDISPIDNSVTINQKLPLLSQSEVKSPAGKPAKNQILVLDGARAIACLSVIMWHLNQITPALQNINNYMAALMYFGDSGVILFFLLSGFLLFLPYAKALLFDSAWPSTYRFYVRRIFRILPGYYAALFLIVLFFHPEYLHLRFFVSSLNFRFTKVVDGTIWTLAVETIFYLCLPIIAWICRPIVAHGPVHWRMLKLTVCMLVMIAWGLGSKYWGLYVPNTQLDFLIPHAVYLKLQEVVFGDVGNFADVFGVGMLLCMVYIYTQNASSGERWSLKIRRLSPLMWVVGLAILVCFFLWHLYQVKDYVRISTEGIFPFLDPYSNYLKQFWQFWQSIGYALGYGLCLWALLYGSQRIKSLFEWSVLRAIGSISFSLYLLHLPFLYLFVSAIDPGLMSRGANHKVEYFALWCWTIVVIIPVCVVLYNWVEKPGMRMGEILTRKPLRGMLTRERITQILTRERIIQILTQKW